MNSRLTFFVEITFALSITSEKFRHHKNVKKQKIFAIELTGSYCKHTEINRHMCWQISECFPPGQFLKNLFFLHDFLQKGWQHFHTCQYKITGKISPMECSQARSINSLQYTQRFFRHEVFWDICTSFSASTLFLREIIFFTVG